ncbi:MAG: copper chaperone PCu(A)C [Alphaproteobacteria bacterium]|nr:copper chaperone PCu(A)C [Alphaproteobacteria bacterium]
MRNTAGIFVLLAGMTISAAAYAEGIAVTGAWSPPSPGSATTGAAYLNIVNDGAERDVLLSVESSAAARTELHATLNEEGVMKMRPLSAVEIAPGAVVEFAPGGKHVMLMGLTAPLTEGAHYPLTLIFEKAGKIATEVEVKAAE